VGGGVNGGINTVLASLPLTGSSPSTADQTANGWRGTIGGTGNRTVTVYVICA
jgi:hypothetical protein